mgnify:CR=1 FL=1
MILFDSFSVTISQDRIYPLTEKTMIFDSFSATISQDRIYPLTEKTKIFDSFSATIANYADTLAYRNPFCLITHKKK